MTKSTGHVLHNLVYFGRLLRASGLDIQPDGISNLALSVKWISLERRQDFYHAARSLLVRRQRDLVPFDRAFDQFWRAKGARPQRIGSQQQKVADPAFLSPALDQGPGGSEGLRVAVQYSPREVLREKDFAELDADELEAVKPMLANLAWKLGQRRTRRWRRGGADEIDVRRTLRQSLRFGGEPLQLSRRERRSKPRGLVVLADISGSMERYSSILLHFVFGLSASLEQGSEAFVFSTRLTRITRQLRGHDLDRALQAVATQVPDWSGGTRIGQAIKSFNFTWARQVLARGAVVLVVSDGWDRGDVDLLRIEVARLQRSSFRLIWLNPLLGSPDYRPLTRGMQAALPYVDDFLPIHNLSSVEDLARRLAAIDERRPARKQQADKRLLRVQLG